MSTIAIRMAAHRFQHALRALRDCRLHLEDNLSAIEADARQRLVESAADILDALGLLPVHVTEEKVSAALQAAAEHARGYASSETEGR
jgi:hypothetical protein